MTTVLRADCERSMQVIRTNGTRLRTGRAAVHTLRRLGWWWLAPVAYPPLLWIAEALYRLVAANRRRFAKIGR